MCADGGTIAPVELLADCSEPDLDFAHNLESELGAIAAVHPLRRSELERLVAKANAHFTDVERMISIMASPRA